MRLSNRERNKSILIIVLLLLCMLQMGILWSEKNPGIPFFTLKMGKNGPPDMEEIKKNYYRPDAIFVAEGLEDTYWFLETKSSLYKSIWKDMRESYLGQIIRLKPSAAGKTWDELIKMKSIIVEFKESIPAGIIRYMTEVDESFSPAVKEIYKIAIRPSENINYNKNTLYVYDGQTVYKYVVDIEQGNMKKEEYSKAIDTIRQNEMIFPMTRLGSFYPSLQDSGLLANLEENKTKKIWDLFVKVPDEIALKRENIDQIQEYLLDEYRGSMVSKLSDDGNSVIFSDPEQVIRFYQNGFFDYQYRSKDGDKGLVEEAFDKALKFIEPRRGKLVEGADMYLSSIEEKTDYYVFTFDYVMDDMEIKIRTENGSISPAVVICANRDRVVDVKWYIKTFSYNDYFNFYSQNFNDFYDYQLVVEYPEIEDRIIHDISTHYLCSENGLRAEPYWYVETDQKPVLLKMRGQGE